MRRHASRRSHANDTMTGTDSKSALGAPRNKVSGLKTSHGRRRTAPNAELPFLPFEPEQRSRCPALFSPQMALLNEVAAAPSATHAAGQYGEGGNILTQQVGLCLTAPRLREHAPTAKANSEPGES